MPQISVIVPVYQAEAYLDSCVQSILSQTFTDWELILVDDGSPDRSGAMCDAYVCRDSRIQVLHQTNQGQAAARNHGLTRAKGRWICFVDSDDLIHPQMLQRLHQAAQEGNARMSMCFMWEAPQISPEFFEVGEPSWDVLPMDEQTLLTLHDQDEYPGWVACAKLISRELVEAYPFREGRVYEDNEAVCRWIYQAGRLARIPDKLYFYRTNPDSTTKQGFSEKRLDYLWALESILTFWGSVGYVQLRQRFLERYAEAAASCILGARQYLGRPDLARKTAHSARRFLRREKLRLTKPQFELLLDAAHPRLIRLYWPAEACLRTLRGGGINALVSKIVRRNRKGDGP